jgi:outer membrane protein assembly factor BamB
MTTVQLVCPRSNLRVNLKLIAAVGVRMRRLVLAMALGLFVVTAAAPSMASGAPPAAAWTVSVGPAGAVAMPVVYDGRAFTVDTPLVTAVDLTSGDVAWQVDHTIDYPPLLGLPSLVNGQIAVPWAIALQAGAFDHDPETGAVTSGPGGFVLGHIVTRGTHRASLNETFEVGSAFITLDYGRNDRAGYIATVDGAPPEPYSDPVIVGDHVWVGYGGSLMRFDRRGRCVPVPDAPPLCGPNGTADIIGNIVGLAAGPNGTIVATTDDGVLQVFDGATGVALWRSIGSPGPGITAPTVRSDLITLGYSHGATKRTGVLFAYPATGCGASECSPSWAVDVNSPIVSAPSIGGGFVVVGSRNRNIVAVSISACAAGSCSPIPLGRVASTITGGPVVGDHMVVVGTASGDLAGFREP